MGLPFLDAAGYAYSIHALPPVLVGFLTLALGLTAFIRDRGNAASVAFLLLTGTSTVWLLCYAGIYSAVSESVAMFWIRAQSVAVGFIPTALYVFSITMARRFRRYFGFVLLSIFLSILFSAGVVGTDWFIQGIYRYHWGYYANYGASSAFFMAFLFVAMAASIRIFWGEYRNADTDTKKRRFRTFLIGFSVSYLGVVDYFPAFGISVYPFGYVPVSIFLAIVGSALWRYYLVDITPSFAAEHILKTIADALVVIDREGIVRVANKAANDLFLDSCGDLVGRPISSSGCDFFRKDKLAWLIWKGKSRHHEVIYRSGNGEETAE